MTCRIGGESKFGRNEQTAMRLVETGNDVNWLRFENLAVWFSCNFCANCVKFEGLCFLRRSGQLEIKGLNRLVFY